MCGEKARRARKRERAVGSPPHVRGKGKTQLKVAQFPGITPACAGKSNSDALRVSGSGDHPRMCGEKMGVSSS